MTPQEVFDIVVTHLRKQGAQAYDHAPSKGGCMYRTSDGLKCAVGCLIPDGVYNPSMEGKSLAGLLGDTKFDRWYYGTLGSSNYLLLATLQETHDHFDVPLWEQRFKAIAANYNLEYSPP